MKNFAHRIALFGLGFAVISLAAALALGFTELLSHIDLGHLGADASRSSTADAHSMQAVLVNSLGVFEMLAQWLVALAGVVGLLVLPMAGLVLLGLGGVCLHGSIAGLRRPSAETTADVEPVFGFSPMLRKLNPAFLSFRHTQTRGPRHDHPEHIIQPHTA